MTEGPTRRATLGLLAGGIASLTGCSRGERREAIAPVEAIPGVVPGEPRAYATALVEDGLATGVLVTTHDGRPTKIEGNPRHPTSLGGTGPREQAALLGLYDPHRTGDVRHGRVPVGFRRFVEAFAPGGEAVGLDGAGVHLLLEPTSSPTTLRLLDLVRARLPGVTVHAASPLDDLAAREGARAAFGAPVDVVPDLTDAAVLATFDADPLGEGPLRLRHAREWASRRRGGELLGTWAVEAATTLTGAKADHRLAVRPSRVPAVLARVATTLLGPVGALAAVPVDAREAAFAERLGDALRRAGPRARLLVGRTVPAWGHALAHLLHARLGAPVTALPPVRPVTGGLVPLLAALDAGLVRTLLVLGGNPAYGAPAELRVPERLARAGTIARLGAYDDETSALATWTIPALHDLERWGDARAADGTASILQPTIAPLFAGRTVDQVLAALTGAGEVSDRDLVRATWNVDEPTWRGWLREGVVPGTASAPLPVSVDEAAVLGLLPTTAAASSGFEAVFHPCPKVLDGRHANNAWLQELPHPLTRVAWTNTATLGPDTADRLGVEDGDLVRVRRGDVEVELPVVVDPAQAEDTVALALGYGRRGAEAVADGIGADVAPLRPAASPWTADGLTLTRSGHVDLPRVQLILDRQGRPVARHHDPSAPAEPPRPWPQLYGRSPVHLSAPRQWGMAIDLSACVGCGACVVACQAENNVPVVGPVEVARGRVMHWIRVDRYVETAIEGATRDVFQPMPCQHCEQAPCEVVCPVYATSHSPDGLNAMVFNRCVGTRFCSDACPYKVRRFNWFRYSARVSPLAALAHNPDVTVRDRGVMEKCSFCLQRIRAGERRASLDDRPLRDGEIVPACAQACPAEAIVFGDVADPASRVSALHVDARTYEELGELGTRPRVRYLAALRDEERPPPTARSAP